MRLIPPLFANLILLVSAIGFGNLLAPLFPSNFERIDRLACTLLGGFGVLGCILFCVGQVWFSRPAIILILILGILIGIRPLAWVVRNCRTILRELSLPVLPVMIVTIVLVVTAIGGLAEPVGDMNNDAIAYHYLGPKVWVRDAVIRPVPDEVLTAFPATVETLYAALTAMGGNRAPQFFSVIALSLTLLLAAGLAIRLGLSQSAAWWTAALLITMPAWYLAGIRGFIDVLFAGFVVAAARIGFDAREPGNYVAFGLFCGIAMSTKYTALVSWPLLLFCSFLVLVLGKRSDYSTVLKGLGIASAVAIAVACPVYIRNWVLLGSPIYPPPPGLASFFHPKYMLPEAVQNVYQNALGHGRGMGGGFWRFLELPFNLTYHTANFRGAGGIGLAPLALAPLGVIATRRDGFAKGLALFALLQMCMWFLTIQESRYICHIYTIAAVFAVLGWEYVARLGSRTGAVFSGLVVAVSILYGLVMILPGRVDDLHAAFSSSFESERKHREIPFLESFDYLKRETSVSKVLILDSDAPAYYSDKDYVKPAGRWGEHAIPGEDTLEAALSEAPALHVSHVLDVRWDGGKFQVAEPHPGLRLVFEATDQRIYAVIPPAR